MFEFLFKLFKPAPSVSASTRHIEEHIENANDIVTEEPVDVDTVTPTEEEDKGEWGLVLDI